MKFRSDGDWLVTLANGTSIELHTGQIIDIVGVGGNWLPILYSGHLTPAESCPRCKEYRFWVSEKGGVHCGCCTASADPTIVKLWFVRGTPMVKDATNRTDKPAPPYRPNTDTLTRMKDKGFRVISGGVIEG